MCLAAVSNPAGARTAEEAVTAATAARMIYGTDFIKLEIHPDPKYLLPDPIETLRAAEKLVKMGFMIAGHRYGRVHQHRVRSHLHGFRRMRGGAYAGIDHHGHPALINDDLKCR